MPFDAFISYSSKDKIAADTACGVLEGAGVRCWIAPRDIRPGGEYGAAIIDAIDQCRVMVLIFSSSANASGQIHREIERAVAKGVAIVPVRIEEIAPTKSMEYFLGAIHWLDALTPPIEKHLQHLAETVKAILQVDTSTHSALLDESSRAAAAKLSPGQEADRPEPHLETTRTSGETDSLISKKTSRTRWLLPALSAGICVILLAGGVWLYQDRVQSPAPPPNTPQPPPKQAEVLVPETVPFISDSERAVIRSTYLSAPDHKALAISTRSNFITGQKDDETAKTAALELCKRVSGSNASHCQLYAVGNTVVFTGGRPPLPPEPWLVRDPSIERPLVAKDVPLISDSQRTWLEKNLPSLRNPKAFSINRGQFAHFSAKSSTDEAARRSLEWCGYLAGAPCLVVAVDDVFVVPIPAMMKVTDFFHAGNNTAIAPELRADVARRLANATSGWNVVAVGTNGRPGLGLRAAKEQDGVTSALADCNRQDRSCRVIAIGPFSVEPLLPSVEQNAPPQPPPAVGQTFRDRLANGEPCPMCPEIVTVPAGSFTMGSPDSEPEHQKNESPQRPVTIKASFAVGRFAVTRGEYRAFVAATSYKLTGGCFAMLNGQWTSQLDKTWEAPGYAQDDRHPVVCVSWQDAKAYVAWLSSLTGQTYRLLSEAEREYVTRAGTTTPFWWGSTITPDQANYWGARAYNGGVTGKDRRATMAVDSFLPNPWGLFNVHGNVGELTEDCWNPDHEQAPPDGLPRTGDCEEHVYRNGGYNNIPRTVRAAHRGQVKFDVGRNVNVGFRIARTIAP